jgi:cyclase
VLPGHGDAGGPGILLGQQAFLRDLYAAVQQQIEAGKTLPQIAPVLPERDSNRIPKDLSTDVAITYAEITQHQPAGALPHEWK